MKLLAMLTIPKLDNVAKVTAIAAAIFGAAFGTYKYIEVSSRDQISQTLAMVKEFYSDPLDEQRAAIRQFIEENFAGKSQLDRYIIDKKNALVVAANENIRSDFISVIHFLDSVHDCVQAEICSAKTANENFGVPASELAYYFIDFVVALRINEQDNFGRSIFYYKQNLGFSPRDGSIIRPRHAPLRIRPRRR